MATLSRYSLKAGWISWKNRTDTVRFFHLKLIPLYFAQTQEFKQPNLFNDILPRIQEFHIGCSPKIFRIGKNLIGHA